MREFEILRHIYAQSGGADQRVIIPPGDDMALLRLQGRELLAAVDQIVDGRHFVLARTPLTLVGRKAITRSLSDLAAMAGRPLATLVAAVLPPDFGHDRATQLFDAMSDAARAYDCPLIGGDLAVHRDAAHPLTCSVTVLGEPSPTGAITRSGAHAGDTVYVTGALGGSIGEDGLGRHLTFEPRIPEAQQLAAQLGDRLHAMIDISDGLGRDASHIAEQSRVALELDAERIPCAPGLDWRRAAGDGEDYELLFTATGTVPTTLGENVPVTAIGRVIPRDDAPSLVQICDGTQRLSGDELGWQHQS